MPALLAAVLLGGAVWPTECPSVSADGTWVAFKVDVDEGSVPIWGDSLSIDLATMERTLIGPGTRGLDD